MIKMCRHNFAEGHGMKMSGKKLMGKPNKEYFDEAFEELAGDQEKNFKKLRRITK